MRSDVRERGFTLVEILIVVAVIGLLATIALPAFVRARVTSQKTVCISNLRQIHSGKEQWAMINNKANGAAVVEAEVQEFIKGHGGPQCPGHGTYNYQAVGSDPTCDKAGHVLP